VGAFFLLNYLNAKAAKVLYISVYSFFTVPFSQAVQEIKESHYELLFLILALYILRDFNQTLDDFSLNAAYNYNN
ncbi:MAG: hypothetical protein ACK40V_10935, partial [Anaerolineales bacterium]